MESILDWTTVLFESMKSFGIQIMLALPGIIGAILLVFLGWVVGKIVARILSRVLRAIKFDKLFDKHETKDFLAKMKISIKPSEIVGKFIFWLIFLLFIVTATETLGWTIVATEITNLIRFIPNLFIGIVIFVFGLYLAKFIKSLLTAFFNSLGMAGGKIISNLVFYIIMIIITLTALKQTGINTHFIDNNVTIIIALLVGAFAISFAISSRDILQNILAGFYSKNNFRVGQKIRINNNIGEILRIDSVHLVLKVGNEKTVYPVRKLITETIDIIKENDTEANIN